ncbi:MAG: MTAP family purine nucleoside phosphorylase, partial [Spirochaetes bacterium]|nr:MTAP family purine nucleoside phosphorylase [Spirochaetota bacterium]
PFGEPSSKYLICDLEGIKIAFLSRHSKGHRILPSELNNRANIYGFKKLGVKHLIGVSAVGSLREEIMPSHLVFPDQIIDRTKGRVSSFFGSGIVAHVGFAEPFCHNLINILSENAEKLKINYHKNKTYVCMEGPLFSTKAESNFHRMIGGDIIGMTAIPEAKLAREAEICYGIIALSTDYDCWREGEESVTLEMILETIGNNISNAKKLLQEVLPKISYENCSCQNSLNNTIMTAKEYWPEETKNKLDVIIKKYL